MSACDFLAENVPWPTNANTLVYLSFGLARVFDEMSLGLWREAEDTVDKLLVACEQSSRQNGLPGLSLICPSPPGADCSARARRDRTTTSPS